MSSNYEELLKTIRHYQENLDKYSLNGNEPKVLSTLKKLKQLPIATCHLEDTGIGRTVNALRKTEGKVGEAAKVLILQWKDVVLEEASKSRPEQDTSSESKTNSREKNESSSHNSNSKTRDKKENHHKTSSEKYRSDTVRSSSDKRENNKTEKENKSERHSSKVKYEIESSSESDSSDSSSESEESEDEATSSDDTSKKNKKYDNNGKNKDKGSSKRTNYSSNSEGSDYEEKSHKSKKSRGYSDGNQKSKDKKHENDSRKSSHSNGELSKKHSSKRKHSSSSSDSEENCEKKPKEKHGKIDKEENYKLKYESKSKTKEKSENKTQESSSNSKSSSRSDTVTKKELKDSKDHSSHSSKHESKSKHSQNKSSSSKHTEKHRSSKEETQKKDKKPANPNKSKDATSKSSGSKPKLETVKSEKIVNGIDSESGASFAEALGMCAPMVYTKSSSSSKKKPSTSTSLEKTSKKTSGVSYTKPEKTTPHDEKHVPNLLKEQPSEPLHINISNLLPEITPHYKPVGLPLDSQQRRQLTPDEALSQAISNKNMRTKVYSGNKVKGGEVESLFNICVKVLQDNIDAMECTGGVPYHVLKPVLERATPDQLFNMEHHNPYLIEDTDELWRLHCSKEFRTKKREEMETWRDMYMRCLDEREAKLNAITATIKQSQDKSLPVRTTKLAYVDSVAKPPRNIARKQAKNGTVVDRPPSKVAKLTTLATSGDAGKVSVPNPGSRAVSGGTTAVIKPKKAPLMAKTLSLFKNRFKR